MHQPSPLSSTAYLGQGIWIVTNWPLVRGSEMVKSTKKHDHSTKIIKILELVSFCHNDHLNILTILIWPMTRPLRVTRFGYWPRTRPSDCHRMVNTIMDRKPMIRWSFWPFKILSSCTGQLVLARRAVETGAHAHRCRVHCWCRICMHGAELQIY
jgi:hypothetical protein